MATPAVATYAPDGSDQRWLPRSGWLSGLSYGSVLPGGDAQLSGTLRVPPASARKALDAGRIIRAYAGGLRVWDGALDQPAAGDDGWSITGHGLGVAGGDMQAYYTGAYSAAGPVTAAISRGLRWTAPASWPAGLWLGQPTDPAMVDVTEHMNTITTPGGYTWFVGRWGLLAITTPATAPTRLLVTTSPMLRTLHGYYTRIWARYQSAADSTTGAATFATTYVENTANRDRHGPRELPIDLTPAGTLTAGAAQAVISSLLGRYQAASYGQQLTIRPGQLLTMGGVPVSLATQRAGFVVQLLIGTGSSGADFAPSVPPTFLVGEYTYNAGDGTASLTPYQSARYDLAAMLSNWVATHPAPTSPAK